MPAAHTQDQEKGTEEKKAEAVHTAPTPAPEPVSAPITAFDDEDPICFVRRNWGTADIPADKVDYVDEFQITGGIGRNVPYGRAKKWLKTQRAGGYILANNATIEDIAKVTGRDPSEPKNIAAAVQSMSAEKIAAILGDEEAIKLARDILRQASEHEGLRKQDAVAPRR